MQRQMHDYFALGTALQHNDAADGRLNPIFQKIRDGVFKSLWLVAFLLNQDKALLEFLAMILLCLGG